MNQGYSSTLGLEINMNRFNSVSYNKATKTAEVGTGLIWDDVYTKLAPYGVRVNGARSPGIGVGGLLLGGEADHASCW
jgi:FAD/FMN-containing dehydrogenase